MNHILNNMYQRSLNITDVPLLGNYYYVQGRSRTCSTTANYVTAVIPTTHFRYRANTLTQLLNLQLWVRFELHETMYGLFIDFII